MWNKPTRRSVVAEVMNANTDKAMEDVLPLIVEAELEAGFECDLKVARRHYASAVRNGRATGVMPERKVASPKPRKKKTKIEVATTASPKQKKSETKETITDQEKDAVVQANMKRLMDYRAKLKDKEQDEEIKKEAQEQKRSDDYDTSFDDPYASPSSLSVEQVSNLTGY